MQLLSGYNSLKAMCNKAVKFASLGCLCVCSLMARAQSSPDTLIYDAANGIDDYFIYENEEFNSTSIIVLQSDTARRVYSIDGDAFYGVSGVYLDDLSYCALERDFIQDGDFNGDGLGDMILVEESYWDDFCNEAHIYHAENDSTFLPVSAIRHETYEAVPEDLSGDGQVDFLCTYFGSSSISDDYWSGGFVLYQDGGVYTEKMQIHNAYESEVYYKPIDFVHRNGQIDVAFTRNVEEGGSSIVLYTYDGFGYTATGPLFDIQVDPNCRIFSFDVEGDEDDEFVYCSIYTDTIFIISLNEVGSYAKKRPLNVLPSVDAYGGYLSSTDINLDGRMDLIYQGDEAVSFYLLNDAVFGLRGSWCTLNKLINPRVRQIDANPLPDIFTSNNYGVYLYYNVDVNCPYEPGVFTSIVEDEVDNKVKIYPNPVNDLLQVEVLLPYIKGVYHLLHISGAIVATGLLDSHLQASIDVSGLVPGIYMLQIEGESINYAQSFVIQR
jgi:hypothetical protein